MKKELLEKEINLGKSTREIAISFNCSQSTIKHWLKKHNLKTHYKQHNVGGKKDYFCKNCGESNPDKFRKSQRIKSRCIKCDNQRVSQLQKENKKKIVEYMGGGCKLCNYSKSYSSLDLHHLDPSNKDPNFENLHSWSWVRIENELKKCILVCRNCHGEIHEGITEL